MESILRDDIFVYLSQHNLNRSSEHGFMAGRSCLTNLLEFLEELTNLVDQGHAVDIVYLDFYKAFDMVPHRRLNECLRGKSQRVVLNGNASGWRIVLSGVS